VQTLKDEISQSKKEAAQAQEVLTEKEAALEASTKRVWQLVQTLNDLLTMTI
jgi:hypothetical protein